MKDQQNLSDFLLKIVLWVLLVLNLRTNGSNTVLNNSSLWFYGIRQEKDILL